MPILNYTTEIPAERTVGDITSLLIRKQAKSITTDFDESGELCSISFVMPIGGVPIRFLLPSNVTGVEQALLRDEPWSSRRNCGQIAYADKMKRKAKWVAWRILYDWVKAQIALVESNQAQAAQVFMPFAVQPNGETVFELFTNQMKQLGNGSEVA
jgi:hypothetical protein